MSYLRTLYHIIEWKMIIFSTSRIPRHGILPWRIIIMQCLVWISQLFYCLMVAFSHLSTILTDGSSRHLRRPSFIYILSCLIIYGLCSYIRQWILLLGPSLLWSSLIIILCLLLLLMMLRYSLFIAGCTSPLCRSTTIKQLRVVSLHLMMLLLMITHIDCLRVVVIVVFGGLMDRLFDNRIKELKLHNATVACIARFKIHVR